MDSESRQIIMWLLTVVVLAVLVMWVSTIAESLASIDRKLTPTTTTRITSDPTQNYLVPPDGTLPPAAPGADR